MHSFLKTLEGQRWDDHRYYHQSRINQTLHLVSAVSFVCAYVLLFIDPALAALLGWGVSMVTRQARKATSLYNTSSRESPPATNQRTSMRP